MSLVGTWGAGAWVVIGLVLALLVWLAVRAARPEVFWRKEIPAAERALGWRRRRVVEGPGRDAPPRGTVAQQRENVLGRVDGVPFLLTEIRRRAWRQVTAPADAGGRSGRQQVTERYCLLSVPRGAPPTGPGAFEALGGADPAMGAAAEPWHDLLRGGEALRFLVPGPGLVYQSEGFRTVRWTGRASRRGLRRRLRELRAAG